MREFLVSIPSSVNSSVNPSLSPSFRLSSFHPLCSRSLSIFQQWQILLIHYKAEEERERENGKVGFCSLRPTYWAPGHHFSLSLSLSGFHSPSWKIGRRFHPEECEISHLFFATHLSICTVLPPPSLLSPSFSLSFSLSFSFTYGIFSIFLHPHRGRPANHRLSDGTYNFPLPFASLKRKIASAITSTQKENINNNNKKRER